MSPAPAIPEEPVEEVFENPNSRGDEPVFLFFGAIGVLAFVVVNFVLSLKTKPGPMSLHMTTTLPTIIAVGMIARALSMRNLPRCIVVGPAGIEVTTKRSTRRYSWSEIGSAAAENVFNTPKMFLRITDPAGKTLIRVDDSFPDYDRLVKLVESFVDAKPDDTSLRIHSRKGKWAALLCAVVGTCLGAGAVFIGLETRREQREKERLLLEGVPGEGEIVRRFVAPDGVTRRIEYRVAGSAVRNVEVEPFVWDQLEDAKTVPVVYVADEPGVSRLESGEVRDEDFTKTPRGGYLMSALSGVMALFMLGLSPLAWMGYDLVMDEKQRAWKLKRYGRVVWASRKEVLEQEDDEKR